MTKTGTGSSGPGIADDSFDGSAIPANIGSMTTPHPLRPPAFQQDSTYPNGGRIIGPLWAGMWATLLAYGWMSTDEIKRSRAGRGSNPKTVENLLYQASNVGILESRKVLAAGRRGKRWVRQFRVAR